MGGGVTATWSRGVWMKYLRGELDLAEAAVLRSELARLPRSPVRAVVVDLAEVTFVDHIALGVLIDLAANCRSGGIVFVLSSPRPVVRRVLQIVAADAAFLVVPDVREAVALAELSVDLAGGPAGRRLRGSVLSSELRITVSDAGALRLMRLDGHLGLADVPQPIWTIRSSLAESQRILVCDLEGLAPPKDSLLMAFLAAARPHDDHARARLRLVAPGDGLYRQLHRNGVDRRLPVHRSVPEARRGVPTLHPA